MLLLHIFQWLCSEWMNTPFDYDVDAADAAATVDDDGVNDENI